MTLNKQTQINAIKYILQFNYGLTGFEFNLSEEINEQKTLVQNWQKLKQKVQILVK